ncbi:transposase [Streptomyces sp. NPDC127092]|uniref:transposase n=1 Tax=Streptomyces sp. NPDC127092 TaxID=3347135 RepID=UPI00364A8595
MATRGATCRTTSRTGARCTRSSPGGGRTGASTPSTTKARRGPPVRGPGRRPPTAAIIDSQSVRAAETVGAGSRGYDTGKKEVGRERHVIVDTIGLLLVVMVTSASVQDRDGAFDALKRCEGAD